jgi:hypothetical protein
MPYDDPEGDDPHEIVGVLLPGDETSTREMARAFAEELAQLGKSREQILDLIRDPFYAGAHRVLEALGEEEIDRIVDESVELFGGFRVSVSEPVESRERAARRVRLRVVSQ